MGEPREVIAAADIDRRVTELAAEISGDYEGRGELLLIGVLKGAFVFLADLGRRLTIPRAIEFIALESYGMQGSAGGAVRPLLDIRRSIEGRHVLVVEDIVDSGRTLTYLMPLLASRGPASLKIATLVRKPQALTIDVPIDYVGFDIPDVWVVGYGLDYAEQWRMLPYVGEVKASPISSSNP